MLRPAAASTTSAPPLGASARKPSAASAERRLHDRPLGTLKQRLEGDLRTAMRSQDVVRRETVRLCLSAIRNEEVARRGPLDDPAELAVLGRQARMRRESIEAFRRGGRDELVAKETAELGVIEKYLPAQLGESDVREAILRAIAETGASGPGAQGKVMQRAMVELRGRADGKLVAGVVARLLAGGDPK